MPSTVEQLSPTRVKFTIEMPFSDLKPALDKAYKDIAGQVSVPGFRKGKVPPAVIDQRFGRGAVLQEAINDALPTAYSEAVDEHKITPLGQPEVDITKLEDGELVEFTAEVDVRPEFDLPDFSTISVEVDSISVTDEDVDSQVEMMRQRFATQTEVDRGAADGDIVTIDLVAKQHGEVLDDGTAEDVNYRIGAGGMVDGLDEAVTGLKAGESKTFTAELVGGAHAGEEAEITVLVSKVAEQELPELDDEWASLVSQFDTVEEMRADIREALTRNARLGQAAVARDRVLEEAIKLTEFELPENLLNNELESRRQQVTQQLTSVGMTLDQYLKQAEDEPSDNEDDFWADIDRRGTDALRAQIILDKLVETEEPEVTDQDFTQLIFAKAQQNGVTPQEELEHMREHNHMPEWLQEVRRSKVLATMVTSATVTDTNGEAVDVGRLAQDGSLLDKAPTSDETAPADEAVDTDDADTAEDTQEAPQGE